MIWGDSINQDHQQCLHWTEHIRLPT